MTILSSFLVLKAWAVSPLPLSAVSDVVAMNICSMEIVSVAVAVVAAAFAVVFVMNAKSVAVAVEMEQNAVVMQKSLWKEHYGAADLVVAVVAFEYIADFDAVVGVGDAAVISIMRYSMNPRQKMRDATFQQEHRN